VAARAAARPGVIFERELDPPIEFDDLFQRTQVPQVLMTPCG
jgi:hypothetical protein